MQISRKLTEIEMITYQRKPHETSSQFLWSYHLGRDDLDLTLIHPALLRWSELELIHPPEPRLCTYRVCTYRVLSQLNVSEHFIRSCLCKVAAAILVTISLPLVAIRLE